MLFLFTGIFIQAGTTRFSADSCGITANVSNPPVLPDKPGGPDIVVPDFTLGEPRYAWVDEEIKQYPVVPDISSARNAPAWTLPYSFDVSPTGASTVSIPIYAPRGTGVATPQLTLSYNSQAGNGILGAGFSIGGLSCISRGPCDIWHDGTAHGVDLCNDDAIYLDGKRLMLRSGTAMTNGATYSPEDLPFTTITFFSDNGFTGFILRTEDGHTMTFGGNENSTLRVPGNNGVGIVYAWYVRETTDSNGNAMFYQYSKNGGFSYISEIDYGCNTGDLFGMPVNKLRFYYEQRPDVYPVNISGVTGKMDRRLKYIETSSSDSIYLVYNLSYKTDHVSGKSQLCNISASKNFNDQFCMLQMDWKLPGSVSASILNIYTDNTVIDDKRHIFTAADVNGDGISDIIDVQFGYRQADIDNSFGKVPATYCTPYISSTDNSGKVIYSRGRTLDIGTFLPAMKGGILSLVSADGRHADIIIPELNTSGNSDHLSLHVLTGGDGGLIDRHTTEPVLQLAARHKSVPLSAVLDTDNDGRSEILILENSPSPLSGNIYGYYTIRYPATDGKLDYSGSSIALAGTPKRLFAADFNSDGMTDVMVVTDKGYTIFLNRGYGSIDSWKRINGITVSDATQLEFGDFNGDGVADFVAINGSSLTLLTGDGKGNFTAEKTQTINELNGNTDKEYGQVLVYDFNGDGRYALRVDYGPDGERFTTTLSKDGRNIRKIRFSPDGEYIEVNGNVREFTYLGNGLLYYRENGGEGKILYMFSDHQGSITGIYDADGSKLFRASYSPWGTQQVSKNEIGFIRGYTGHEMLREFSLINMNGRLYDPLLGRFLSPDNFVQMPESSQGFNRYSYCLNNPLKYTDPSGELFGIDDLLFVATIGAISGYTNAIINGGNAWRGAFFCGLSSAATYGIGSAFGHTFGTVGTELLRAGSHGLANGIIGTIGGHKFGPGFASGFMSSLAGSCIQAFGIESPNILIGGCSITGGLTSYALGEDFLYGANIGMNIASYNHG